MTLITNPFIGGGVLFFELQPKKAVIADVNAEIITVEAKRAINSKGSKRGNVNEVLIKNY